MSALLGHTMSDSYFEQMRARDKSAGSAVCQNCIYMFEGGNTTGNKPQKTAHQKPAHLPPMTHGMNNNKQNQPVFSPQATQTNANPDLQRANEAIASMFVQLSVPQKAKMKKKTVLIASIIAGILIIAISLGITLNQRLSGNSDTVGGGNAVSATAGRSNVNEDAPDARVSVAESPPVTRGPESEPAPEPEPDVFPISFTAFNNNYSITGYEVGIADNGTTTLTLLGYGYSILPFRNGRISIPVWASFYSSGVEHESTGCSTSSDSVTYSFSVTSQPERIVFTNGETNEIIVSFDAGRGSVAAPAQTPGSQPATDAPGSITFYPASDRNERGNTVANIMNGGLAVEKGGWIYYSIGDSLYRVRIDGTEQAMLTQSGHMGISYINVVGDWIYYVDRYVDFNNYSSNNTLYRIRTDGSHKARLSDRHCEMVHVVGEWIYFSTFAVIEDDWEKIMDFGIYRIRTDGTQESLIEYGNLRGVTVYGEWVYFIFDGDLHRVQLYGGGGMQLTYGAEIAGYLVSGDRIFYSDYSQGYSLFSIWADGTGLEMIHSEHSSFLNTDGSYIYFSDFDFMFEDREYGIYRINFDGTGKTLIHNAQAIGLSIVGGSIYFRDIILDGYYMINTDGTGLQRMN